MDARKAVKIEERIHIARTPAQLYTIWRDFQQLPAYVSDIESVRSLRPGVSHWVAKVPGGHRIEWDAELVNDLPNELIAWKTVANPDVAHAGSVHFHAAGDGTDMRIVIDYEPPGGTLSLMLEKFTRLFGLAPESKIKAELVQFKQKVEASFGPG